MIKLPLSNLLRTNKFYKIKYEDALINKFINDYINKAVKQTVNKIIDAKVSHVVIGYNKGFKQNGIKNKKLKGKNKSKVNQSFVSIPLARFVNKLKFILSCIILM